MNVTALLAHPDDELMCAGTLARLAVDHSVSLVTVFVDDERRVEWRACCAVLGVAPHSPPAPVLEDDFGWTRRTVRTLEEWLPPADLWVTHRADDANTSHGVIGRLARTFARKNRSTVLEVDQSLPGGVVPQSPNVFVNISDHVGTKRAAVACYGSQLARYPGMGEAIRHRDALYGWEHGVTAAEGFTVHKAVWL